MSGTRRGAKRSQGGREEGCRRRAPLTCRKYSTRRMLQPRMEGLSFLTRMVLPRQDSDMPEMMWLPRTQESFWVKTLVCPLAR